MASTSLTIIPSTQPSCGNISLQQPIPNCPNGNGTSNNETMGCFIQTSGLYCAPLSTTRGFLYTFNTSIQVSSNSSNVNLPHLIPSLSTATNDNSTNPSPPLLDVDGQPVNYQGPARLGQTCLGIPLPPTTHPLFQMLISIANQRLNDTTGFIPGAGAGQDIFSLRGDCEDGSYCDLSTPGGGVGTCREQFPEFHNCTSYMQCLSLRCDESPFEPAKVTSRRKRALLNFFRPTLEKRVYPNSTVCLSSKIHTHNSTGVIPDDGLGIGGSGDTDGGIVGNQHSSSFPKWMGAVIAIIVILGAAVIFGLARRRKKLRDEKEKKMKAASRTLTERERTRSMTSPTASSDEKNAHRYQVFSEQAQPRQKDQRARILGMFFGSKRQSGDQVNDTSMFYTHRKRADTPSGTEASFVSIEESNASVDSISMERVNTHNEPEPSLSAIEYSDTMPNVSTTEDSQHNPGLGLSIVIPSITTTPSELQQSTERNVFEEGEMPMLPIRYPGGLTPSVNESEAAPSISSYYGTSLSDSSSAYSGSSSHAFLSTLPPTSPHVPNSPISPISPRPLPSTGPSSRLSYRLSTQVTSRKS